MDWAVSLDAPGRGIALTAAAAAIPGTFASSLSERSWMDQGLITGLSAGTHYLLTMVASDVLDVVGEAIAPQLPFRESLSRPQREQRAILLTDLAAIPAAAAVIALLPRDDDESNVRGVARQLAWRLGVTGVGAAVFSAGRLAREAIARGTGASWITRLPVAIPLGLGVALALERFRQREAGDEPPAVAGLDRPNPLLGLLGAGGVVVALGGMAAAEGRLVGLMASRASTRLPGSRRFWTLLGHTAAAGGLGYGIHELWGTAMHRIEAGTTAYEPVAAEGAAGRWTTAGTSGDPASLVSWDGLGREGRRHAIAVVRTTKLDDRPPGLDDVDLSIPAVMGRPAAHEPIQVYVGLDNAPTPAERVALALAELDRTDAWSRSLLVLVSPTGTGYVNYCATAALQYLTLGDVATVTLQYSKRPSPLSLGKVAAAREQNRLLWLQVAERVRELEPSRRPRVVLFGESLGAHTSQDVLMHWGTLGPQALGIDRALWIGTPYASRWKEEVTGAPRPDVDPDLLAVVNDFGQIEAMPAQRRAKLRYVLLSHDNDGVTKFGADLLVRRPRWLGPDRPAVEPVPPASPRGISPTMRWRPVTTFFQSLVDMKNAQIPGAYRAWAHDYRPDLPKFIREVFVPEASDDDVDRVARALEDREARRQSLFD